MRRGEDSGRDESFLYTTTTAPVSPARAMANAMAAEHISLHTFEAVNRMLGQHARRR
jgi:hypothetical protein